MCLAVIGKIKKIKGNLAETDFDGVSSQVNIELVNAKKGDYIMVHAGFAIQKVQAGEAKEIIALKTKASN